MNLRRQLLTLSLAVLGCESIAPRATPDASADSDAAVDAPDGSTSDVVDASRHAPEVNATDVVDAQAADTVDATVTDVHDVVTGDVVVATVEDTVDVATTDTVDAPDVVTVDIVDAPALDTPDVLTPDVVDASVNPFPSTGADGPFPGARVPSDAGVIELEPRVWNFTTIRVPMGVRVQVAPGSATLELRATQEITVEGTIDLSGGEGGRWIDDARYCLGGDTGIPHGPRVATVQRGAYRASLGGSGTPGGNGLCMGQTSALGGAFGGGSAGGACAVHVVASGAPAGAGGGGYAGGGGGARFVGHSERGGDGASNLSDQGGLGATTSADAEGGESRLLGTPMAIYAGQPGGLNMTFGQRGAGGGSIGRTAARDIAVASTFRPGSGGGGGGSFCLDGCASRVNSGGGGGGGGGAVRLASPVSILVARTGALRADGGRGQYGHTPGGGGSGGVIFLSAPEILLYGTVSAVGGGGESSPVRSGSGGLGRVRLSVDPVRCEVTGTINPSIPTGCAPSPDGGVPGQAYVGVWPN